MQLQWQLLLYLISIIFYIEGFMVILLNYKRDKAIVLLPYLVQSYSANTFMLHYNIHFR